MTLTVDITVTPNNRRGFRCTGTVEDDTPQDNPAQAAAAWLGGLDPTELERAALEMNHMNGGSYTAAVLATLARWAGGGR